MIVWTVETGKRRAYVKKKKRVNRMFKETMGNLNFLVH